MACRNGLGDVLEDDDVILNPFLTDPAKGPQYKYYCAAVENNLYGKLSVQEEEDAAPAPAPESASLLLKASPVASPVSSSVSINLDADDRAVRGQKKSSVAWANLWSSVLPPFAGSAIFPIQKVLNDDTQTQSVQTILLDSEGTASKPRDYADAPCVYKPSGSKTQIMPADVGTYEKEADATETLDDDPVFLKVAKELYYPSGTWHNWAFQEWLRNRAKKDFEEGVIKTSQEKNDWALLVKSVAVTTEVICRGWEPTKKWASTEGSNGTTAQFPVVFKPTPWCPYKVNSAGGMQQKDVCIETSLLDPSRFREQPLTIPVNHPIWVILIALLSTICFGLGIISLILYFLKAKNNPMDTTHLEPALSAHREKSDFVSADYNMRNFYDGYDETDSCLGGVSFSCCTRDERPK
jgi:hypothetical protein